MKAPRILQSFRSTTVLHLIRTLWRWKRRKIIENKSKFVRKICSKTFYCNARIPCHFKAFGSQHKTSENPSKSSLWASQALEGGSIPLARSIRKDKASRPQHVNGMLRAPKPFSILHIILQNKNDIKDRNRLCTPYFLSSILGEIFNPVIPKPTRHNSHACWKWLWRL